LGPVKQKLLTDIGCATCRVLVRFYSAALWSCHVVMMFKMTATSAHC